MMKTFGLAMALACSAWFGAHAQISVELILEERQILPGEALPAKIEITNRTGQDLRIGGEADWITFTLESLDGSKNAFARSSVPAVGETLVATSLMATHRLDLAPYLDLSEPGRYLITAQLNVRGADTSYQSKSAGVEVIPGSRIWERTFGATIAGKNEKRKYILNKAALVKDLRLYFRLTDEYETKNIKVFSLGTMVAFASPQAMTDGKGHVHIFFQNGARSFSYHEVNQSGEILVRQRHEISNTKPRLSQDENGKVQVVGGVRRVVPNDLPSQTNLSTNEAETK